jgi:hypothetical protein
LAGGAWLSVDWPPRRVGQYKKATRSHDAQANESARGGVDKLPIECINQRFAPEEGKESIESIHVSAGSNAYKILAF